QDRDQGLQRPEPGGGRADAPRGRGARRRGQEEAGGNQRPQRGGPPDLHGREAVEGARRQAERRRQVGGRGGDREDEAGGQPRRRAPLPCSGGRGVGGEGRVGLQTPHPRPLSPEYRGEGGKTTPAAPQGGAAGVSFSPSPLAAQDAIQRVGRLVDQRLRVVRE